MTALMPETWLKKANRKANQMGKRYFPEKNSRRLPLSSVLLPGPQLWADLRKVLAWRPR